MFSVRAPRRSMAAAPALAAAAALLLAACSGSTINAGTPTGAALDPAAKPCGSVNMAINPWVGYEASAAVVGEVLKSVGCQVTSKNIDENTSWQGFETGEVDIVIENWGKPDLEKKYIDQQKVAQNFGPNGNEGIIGWYVAPWMKEKYPEVTDYKWLNENASIFNTGEVAGGKGQFSGGDRSFVTNDEALAKNVMTNFQVVYLGSEAALIEGFRKSEQNKTPFIGYFYSPQWFLAEVPLVKVDLPPYTAGCDAVAAKVACDYPPYTLNKIVSTKFADTGSQGVTVVKNFEWTNDDQNEVAAWITTDKMTPEAAAKKWIAANPDKVAAWLA